MPVHNAPQTTNLLDVLEKILDKGVVIAGDIKISLADVDLLTIRIRLLIASVDKAREIGMDWWEKDSYYSSRARVVEEEHVLLKEKIKQLEQQLTARELPSNVEEKLSLAVQEDVPGKIDTEVNKDTEQDFDRGKPFPK
jgi:DNA-directed RNA polymerase beta' subunit